MERLPLSVIDTLIYFDGPRLVLCRVNARLHFALSVEQRGSEETWLFAPVSLYDYVKVRSNKSYFGDFFKSESTPYFLKGSMSQDGATACVERLAVSAVPCDFFPAGALEDQELIFCEDEEFGALQDPVSWALAEIGRGAFVDVESAEVVSARQRRVIADVRFTRALGVDDGHIPVKALGKVLHALQMFLESAGLALCSGGAQRLTERLRERLALDAVAAYRGSFAVRLEAREGLLTDDTPIAQAIIALNTALSTRGEAERLHSALKPLGLRSVGHFRAFAAALAGAQVNAEIISAIPGEVYPRAATLSFSDAQKALDSIDERSETEEPPITVVGYLVGLSLKTKYFRVESSDRVYSGKISDECLETWSRSFTVSSVIIFSATMSVQFDYGEFGGEVKERYQLIRLEQKS